MILDLATYPCSKGSALTCDFTWSNSGGQSTTLGGNPHYQLTLTNSATVQIDLDSKVDNFLYLLDSSGSILSSNNNSWPGKDARIVLSLATGTYEVVAATSRNRKSGSFTLTVKTGDLGAL